MEKEDDKGRGVDLSAVTQHFVHQRRALIAVDDVRRTTTFDGDSWNGKPTHTHNIKLSLFSRGEKGPRYS